jgi:hypothetical protein
MEKRSRPHHSPVGCLEPRSADLVNRLAPCRLLLVLVFAPDWDWKALTGLMMFAFASGSVVLILGWVYERIKYSDR